MKLVKQSFEILEQEIPSHKMDDYSGSHFREQYIENMYKHIEKCARICYKSEHKITEDSYKKFVQRMIDSKHYSTLEHGVVYLKVSHTGNDIYYLKYVENPYSIVKHPVEDNYVYITTNYRVIIENGWEEDLQYLCESTEYHERRHTVLLHSCIHTYKDLTRHRKMSFSIESTRYVNYSKTDKFGEMKFIIPSWCEIQEGDYPCYIDDNANFVLEGTTFKKLGISGADKIFMMNCGLVEHDYKILTEYGWKAQQAAEILPQATAADVVMSGFTSDWEFIFKLRTSYIHETGMPHPLVAEIMDPLYNEFVNKGYINKLG